MKMIGVIYFSKKDSQLAADLLYALSLKQLNESFIFSTLKE